MKTYTKHQIIRTKDLDNGHFEVVFNKRSLNFKPGDVVSLYNTGSEPVFIASGISEPWVRLILPEHLRTPNFEPGVRSIRLDLEVESRIPTLITEENPNFLITPAGLGAFFSYVSTYPHKHCKVCYLGDNRVSEGWIKAYHKLVSKKQIKKAKNVYVIGDRHVLGGIVRNPDVECFV